MMMSAKMELKLIDVWVLIAIIIRLNAVVPDDETRHCAAATAKIQ